MKIRYTCTCTCTYSISMKICYINFCALMRDEKEGRKKEGRKVKQNVLVSNVYCSGRVAGYPWTGGERQQCAETEQKAGWNQKEESK